MAVTLRQFVFAGIFVAVGAGVCIVPSLFEKKIYDREYNYGGHASDPEHPSKRVNNAFNPQYVMLLYLDIEDDETGKLGMRVTTLQFPVVSYIKNDNKQNRWKDNKIRIANWINCLNKPEFPNPTQNPSPGEDPSITCHWPSGNDRYVKREGLEPFSFNQPHHFVIYIQNRNIEYHKKDPIWFGKLMGKIKDGKPVKAKKNRSFFAAEVIIPTTAFNDQGGTELIVDNILAKNSKKVIYAKNFFQGWKLFGGYYDLGKDGRPYSLNINAELPATTLTGGASIQVPIILDPDTGNQGGGDPPRD